MAWGTSTSPSASAFSAERTRTTTSSATSHLKEQQHARLRYWRDRPFRFVHHPRAHRRRARGHRPGPVGHGCGGAVRSWREGAPRRPPGPPLERETPHIDDVDAGLEGQHAVAILEGALNDELVRWTLDED